MNVDHLNVVHSTWRCHLASCRRNGEQHRALQRLFQAATRSRINGLACAGGGIWLIWSDRPQGRERIGEQRGFGMQNVHIQVWVAACEFNMVSCAGTRPRRMPFVRQAKRELHEPRACIDIAAILCTCARAAARPPPPNGHLQACPSSSPFHVGSRKRAQSRAHCSVSAE